jgi:hypothetical protein
MQPVLATIRSIDNTSTAVLGAAGVCREKL